MQHYIQRNATIHHIPPPPGTLSMPSGRMDKCHFGQRSLPLDVDLRHHGPMDIDAVRGLPLADQMTFLRGRILKYGSRRTLRVCEAERRLQPGGRA
jgi:hypothetical protein